MSPFDDVTNIFIHGVSKAYQNSSVYHTPIKHISSQYFYGFCGDDSFSRHFEKRVKGTDSFHFLLPTPLILWNHFKGLFIRKIMMLGKHFYNIFRMA